MSVKIGIENVKKGSTFQIKITTLVYTQKFCHKNDNIVRIRVSLRGSLHIIPPN
jgi:hypothetical protein